MICLKKSSSIPVIVESPIRVVVKASAAKGTYIVPADPNIAAFLASLNIVLVLGKTFAMKPFAIDLAFCNFVNFLFCILDALSSEVLIPVVS